MKRPAGCPMRRLHYVSPFIPGKDSLNNEYRADWPRHDHPQPHLLISSYRPVSKMWAGRSHRIFKEAAQFCTYWSRLLTVRRSHLALVVGGGGCRALSAPPRPAANNRWRPERYRALPVP